MDELDEYIALCAKMTPPPYYWLEDEREYDEWEFIEFS